MKAIRSIVSIFLITSSFLISLTGQNVAINEDGASPDNSAILDLKSTSRGLLIPRMTAVQRSLISSPATGLLVFDTDSSSFQFYDGAAWASLDTVSRAPKVFGSAYENNIGGTNSSYSVSTTYIGDTTLTSGALSVLTFSDDNTNGDYIEIPSGQGGYYNIQLTMSFRGNNGAENRIGVFKNSDSDPMAGLAFERSTTNNASGSAAASGIVLLSDNDVIRVKFKTDSNNNDFDIVTQALSIIKVD